eukprot:PhF_6_TR42892/c1_g1_i2/m.64987
MGCCTTKVQGISNPDPMSTATSLNPHTRSPSLTGLSSTQKTASYTKQKKSSTLKGKKKAKSEQNSTTTTEQHVGSSVGSGRDEGFANVLPAPQVSPTARKSRGENINSSRMENSLKSDGPTGRSDWDELEETRKSSIAIAIAGGEKIPNLKWNIDTWIDQTSRCDLGMLSPDNPATEDEPAEGYDDEDVSESRRYTIDSTLNDHLLATASSNICAVLTKENLITNNRVLQQSVDSSDSSAGGRKQAADIGEVKSVSSD